MDCVHLLTLIYMKGKRVENKCPRLGLPYVSVLPGTVPVYTHPKLMINCPPFTLKSAQFNKLPDHLI